MDSSNPQPAAGASLGRLFIVPLLIVASMIACSVIVVLCFGAITSPKDVPVTALLARLEASDGSRKAGMLLPRDKEMWQAASELAMRLEDLDSEVDADELPEIQQRLVSLLERDLADVDLREETSRQVVYFTMLAAAKAGAADAVPLLVDVATTGKAGTQLQALRSLAEMANVPEARRAAGALTGLLRDPTVEIRMVTSAVLANIGKADDPAVTLPLLEACGRIDDSAEVRWNAALALARLGYEDPGGIVVGEVLELLDRTFWDSRRVQYTSDSGEIDRAFTTPEIDERLVAAIGAAEHLRDERIWARIGQLAKDNSLRVAGAARRAMNRTETDPSNGSGA